MAGRILDRAESSYDAATATPADIDMALAAAAGVFAGHELQGIGVAAAGLVDPVTGLIMEVNDAPGLHGYPVTEQGLGALRRGERAGGAPGATAGARRPLVRRRSWTAHLSASVSTGEVLGVGLLYDGEVMAPPGGRSGAHMTVSASGERCTCGNRGCWKTVATTGWLRARARAVGLGGQTSLEALVNRGDALAGQVVEEYAHNLALGLVNVQQLFAPGLFILHGEAREGGERFRTVVEERLRDAVAFSGAEQPRVLVGTAAVDDVALLGGAGLVVSHL
ncbi:Glucokinase OS=Streptomyces antimycoticus OX=68175 GN=SANT12839_001710 PE=4 SV=1 [Streptomyces antimycoticus]